MMPLSDVGQELLQGNDFEHWIKNSKLADKSEDSDTIRDRIDQMELQY